MSDPFSRDRSGTAGGLGLLRVWHACEQHGLDLIAGDEPLDYPRDLVLAEAVVKQQALTTASDGGLLLVDLSMVMTGFTFEEVWLRRHPFKIGSTIIPVASLEDIVAAKAKADRLFLAAHAEQLRRLLGDH